MFCFITSIRSPAMSSNWQRVCTLFERTLVSIFNQTCGEFRVIAVCDVAPSLTRRFDSRLEIIETPMPVDRYPESEIAKYIFMNEDKVRKLRVAMQRARQHNPTFVMVIDADDLVSRRLVSYTLAHPDADAWVIQHGWRYVYGRHFIETIDGFYMLSGSGNILSHRWFSFSSEPEKEQEADDAWLGQDHTLFFDTFTERGAQIRRIPFFAATYTVRNGINISAIRVRHEEKIYGTRNPLRRFAGTYKRKLLRLPRFRYVSAEIRQEFSLDTSRL